MHITVVILSVFNSLLTIAQNAFLKSMFVYVTIISRLSRIGELDHWSGILGRPLTPKYTFALDKKRSAHNSTVNLMINILNIAVNRYRIIDY